MFTSNRRVMQALSLVYKRLDVIAKNEGVLMAKADDVLAAVAKLGSDVSTEVKDAGDKIAALIAGQADPAEAAKLQSALDNINAIDTAVTAFDVTVAPVGTSTGTSS